MRHIKLFEDFSLNEIHSWIEKSIGKFSFKGRSREIFQSKDDSTMFGILDEEGKNWLITASGKEFDPKEYATYLDQKFGTEVTHLDAMLEWIKEAIEYFKAESRVNTSTVRHSEWSDLFASELELDLEEMAMDQFYTIAKLNCGKENAKWNWEK